MDIGAKMISNGRFNQKVCLVLESEQYRYQKFISDIAGNDIRAHGNDPKTAIGCLRDWIRINENEVMIPWVSKIWSAYTEFDFDFQKLLQENDLDPLDIQAIPFSDVIDIMKKWILKSNIN